MKPIVVKTELLKVALPKLGTAIAAKAAIPSIENILCEAEATCMAMTTTDLEMTVSYNVHCENEETLEFEVLKTGVKVKSGTDLYSFKYNSKLELFPKPSELPKTNEVILDDQYLPMIQAAVDSVGKDEARPALGRVCISLRKQAIEIASTDAYILYRYIIPQRMEKETDLLLSPRMIKALDGMKDILIKWDEKKFCFKTQDVVILINRPEFKYPNYNSVIPENEPNLRINTPYLLEAFQKLNLLKNKDASITLSNTSMKAVVDDKDSGLKINSEIPIEYCGIVESLTLNTSNVLRMLHQTNCEQLNLSIQNAGKAIVIRGEDPNYLALIIPTQSV